VKYDDETRQRARHLYEQGGTFHAARQLGIAPRTIREWAQHGQWATSAAQQATQAARSAASRRAWEVRRRQLADDAGEAAAAALARLQERLHAGRIAGIRDLAQTFAVLVERAEQLAARTGGYASPELPAEQQTARLLHLVDMVEQRDGNGSHAS
jgi:uncharacterized NAD(P)/FAD-binding protein YdhS